jgi:hypothetical protein
MFEAGTSGNPRGRPKGSYGGRIQALAELDRMMGRGTNRRLLARVLQEEFRKDPMGFFRSVIMPLLPKESKVALDHDGVIQWRSLISGEPAGNEDCRLPVGDCEEASQGGTEVGES